MQIQSLVSLISLASLRLPSALRMIDSFSASTTAVEETAGGAAYLLNSDTCNEVTEVLVSAASECLHVASPTVLAWSIMLQGLREQAFVAREGRETRQSIRASERFGMADSPDAGNAEQSSLRNSGSLRRLSSTSSDTPQQQTFVEQLLDKVLLVAVEGDPVAFLARAAVDGSRVLAIVATLSTGFCTPFGFDHQGKWGLKMRHILMDLVKASLELIDYQPDLIEAALAVLTGSESYWQLQIRPLQFREAEPAAIFLNDMTLMNRLFYEAQSRFPYETLPFLKFCRALAVSLAGQDEEDVPAMWLKLATTDAFTSALPITFTAYQLIQEDEDASYIQLTANFESFGKQTADSSSYKRFTKSDSLALAESTNLRRVPHGTKGLVLSETKPLVVRWYHQYSPLAYLGMLLNSYSLSLSIGTNDSQNPSIPAEMAMEILDLLSVMLLTATKGAKVQKAAFSALEMSQSIVDKASEGLNHGQDIVSVVLDIFERELSRQAKGIEETHLSILVRCVQFTHALLQVMPDRVWPFLGRSILLGVRDGESQLKTILASTEIPMGQYDFLIGCLYLFESLVTDATTHAVVRKTPSKAVTRFTTAQPLGTGVSQMVMKNVLLSFQRIMLDVYESIYTWKFVQINQKFEINARLSTLFCRLVNQCFGIEDLGNSSAKLNGSLIPAAEYTVRAFLSGDKTDLTQNCLMSTIQESVGQALKTEPARKEHWSRQAISALRLVSSLLRLNTMLGYPPSRLEGHMLASVSLLARTYASHPSFKQPVVELLAVLVQNANIVDGQPASLLGHMGEDAAIHFLQLILLVDQPLCNQGLSVSIWKLLSDVVSKRQRWFAISVLTGEAPRKVIKKKSESASHTGKGSVFHVALDHLSNIGRLPPQIASAMLEFVALAADSWPWILGDIDQHPYFLNAATEYIAQVETAANTTQNRSSQAGMEYYKIQITSSITQILAMYTHYTRQAGKASYAKDLLPNLSYVSKAAIEPPDFNMSLHSNLQRNFEDRFGDCNLSAFKRTLLEPCSLGDSFYYNLEIADQMLRLDSSWREKGEDGFHSEFARANVNLSIVEAQVGLFHSWKFLAVELTKSLATDSEYQKVMVEVVTDCLQVNARNTLPQAVFERLAQSRADLAFTLLQSLIEVQCALPEVKSVVFAAWDTVRAHGTDLAIALESDRATYSRTLLKILCLTLQAHVSTHPSSSPDSSRSNDSDRPHPTTTASSTLTTVLEILKVIVANGFRSLTTTLHSSPSSVLPSDFAILAAILRSSLRIPGIDRHSTTLLSIFSDAQTSRYASTLLSWSDQLALGSNRDPVYGELSINFLLEMSASPALAEALAVEGILTHIANTNLLRHLQSSERGWGPFDAPARMYNNIWTRGILPLLLNLLSALGAPFAAEVASALCSFPGQISRASRALTFYGTGNTANGEGYITLSTISEAQTLTIITHLLDTYRLAGPSAGVVANEIRDPGWERGRVREDVETWMSRRGELKARLVPVGEREEGMCRMRPVNEESGAGSRLEEKAVEEIRVLGLLVSEQREG